MLLQLGHGLSQSSCRSAAGGTGYLDDIIPSVCCDLDATQLDSYGGSGQTWSNLTASPADGAAQNEYNFWRGSNSTATTDDPTFTGTVGDSAAYFTHDGGDYFTSKFITQPVTLYNMHKKTGGTNRWTIVCALQFGADLAQSPWGRGWIGNTQGSYLWKTATSGPFYQDRTGGLTQVPPLLPNTDAGIDYFIAVSVDMEATTNNVRRWVNTTTKTQFSQIWTSESANTIRAFTIGGTRNSTGTVNAILSNASRYYSFALFNNFLDDADISLIKTHLEARHGRTYI